ncbi:MAG TPA: hypothetical protein VFG04_11815 [Planctomycetaceae bacterium]|nr:hypothetical protein [Planctomycetaceae bacterium]
MTYDLIKDRWAESVPQGFHLHFTFGTSALDDRQGKQLFFTTQSGLDGLQDWEGKPLKNESKPQDTIGELQFWGSNEWKQTN